MKPSVTVIIAAYNRPEFLKEAIESVLNQTHPVEQIIVVDDCSPISLENIIRSINNPIIEYVRKEKNSGVSNSRNIGILKSRCDYISILDDDDLYEPQKIEKQMVAMLAYENCVATLTDCSMIGGGTKSTSLQSKFITENDLRKGNPYLGLLARREDLVEELYDENLTLGEDWDIYIRLLKRGDIYVVGEPLYLYRKGDHESITTRAKNITIDEGIDRLAVTYKQRKWLGEKYFRRRIARVMLSYIYIKKNKWLWIKKSLTLAGYKATATILIEMVINQLLKKNK